MTLSPLAADFAAEINAHEWSDATFRFDRAGHRRENDTHSGPDTPLSHGQVDYVKANVAAVVAQVLGYTEGASSFDPHEFFLYAGVARGFRLTRNGRPSGTVTAGLRIEGSRYDTPGSTLISVKRDAHSQDDAMAGLLRTSEENDLGLAPRTTVKLRFEGMVYGEGTVRRIEPRHTWKVVVWDQYNSYPVPRAG